MMKNPFQINKGDNFFIIKGRNRLFSTLTFLVENEGCLTKRIVYNLVDDSTLLQMNISHLKHNTLTDIITFDYSYSNEDGKRILVSEIYISTERVIENAAEFNIDKMSELFRVCIHGALHLCGYKDKTKTEKIQMRAKEDFYLSYLLNVKHPS